MEKINEPAHDKKDVMSCQSSILATDMRVCPKLFLGPYYISATAKDLTRLCLCATSPEPFLFAYVIPFSHVLAQSTSAAHSPNVDRSPEHQVN